LPRTKITVIIPALDEEACIGRLVSAIPRPLVHEVIVVDNNSSDHTAEVARAAGATVISQARRGYGGACAAGARAARSADVLVFMDADLSDDPAELPDVLAPLLAGEADLVLGSRTQVEPGALSPQQIAGNRVALSLIAFLFRRRLRDLPSYKAVRRTVLDQLCLQERTYGWTTELVVKSLKARVRLTEVPTHYRKRAGGQSKVAGTLRGAVGAGCSMLSVVLRCAWQPVESRAVDGSAVAINHLDR
jgi:glycosyltransferase involved in cell wall biosynthesis